MEQKPARKQERTIEIAAAAYTRASAKISFTRFPVSL